MIEIKKTAVFLDRDGVINRSPGEGKYVLNPDEFHMLSGAGEAIHLLNEKNIPVFLISNQRGVSRQLMTEEDLSQITAKMNSQLAQSDAHLDKAYYCIHPKDSCNCRKPLPGMFLKAADEYSIDLSKSFYVGDAPVDVKAGRAAGCAMILVLSGKTREEDIPNLPLKPDHVCADLMAACQWILDRISTENI